MKLTPKQLTPKQQALAELEKRNVYSGYRVFKNGSVWLYRTGTNFSKGDVIKLTLDKLKSEPYHSPRFSGINRP